MSINRYGSKKQLTQGEEGTFDILDKLGLCFREDGTAYIDRRVSFTTMMLYGENFYERNIKGKLRRYSEKE